jgi:hypothetical protein
VTELLTSVLQQGKRCIFCGNPPSEKNREHVIPQWLIELTGDPKRIWHLGVKFIDPKKPDRRFAADQYQFPACEACNSRYSDLEARTKANMTKLLNEQSLSAAEWDDLLDWFDKVRIGLFIGNMILNKDLPIPNPKFFIDQRIGTKDRCVLVYPNRTDYVGLQFIGAGDPVFFHHPTSFMLLVNKLLFVNISSDFLLAPRMGFPFPRTIKLEGPRMRANDFTATLRPKLPLIRFSFYRPTIGVYQAILMKELLEAEIYASLTRADYIQTKLLPKNLFKTRLCVAEAGKPVFLDASDQITPTNLPKPQIKTFDEYCLRFFEYRQVTLKHALEIVEPTSKGIVRLMIKFNGYAIDQTKSQTHSV